MLKKTLILGSLLVFLSVPVLVFTQSTPTITNFRPTTSSPGQTIEINGQNLGPNIQFAGPVNVAATGTVENNNTAVTVVIPNLSVGEYAITVSGPSGSVTSLSTIKIASGSFGNPPY